MRCGASPTTSSTSRRGFGGAGSGVSAGSGEGVRERCTMCERLGRDSALCFGLLDALDSAGASGGASGEDVGELARLITDADSARRVSPTR